MQLNLLLVLILNECNLMKKILLLFIKNQKVRTQINCLRIRVSRRLKH